jgi:hypothetical protein
MSRPPRKVELACEHVRRVNPWSCVATFCTDIGEVSPGVLAGLDAVIVSFDNLRARFLAARLLLAARVPFADAASLAERWQARVSVCDPLGPPAARACPSCPWSAAQLARAGEDTGLPCEAIETGEGFPSTLVMGERAATLAVRELLALSGVVPLVPSRSCELRDDLAALRTQSFRVDRNPECAADHALAEGELRELDAEPGELALGELASRLQLRAGDEIVLAGGELVSASLCRACASVDAPYRRIDATLPACSRCGTPTDPLRRTRRLRFGAATGSVSELAADVWFLPGDRFAVRGADGVRVYAFPAAPLAWEPGRSFDPHRDAARFARLPADWDLARLRSARLGFLGVGHVGAAALAQLAPLPWAGLVLVDRDWLAPHNQPSLALAAERAS